MRRVIPIGFLAAVLTAQLALADTVTWNLAGNGSWNVAANWLVNPPAPPRVPTAADDVFINSAVTISINGAGTGASGVANSVSITAGATISRTGARTLTVTNGISVNSNVAAAISVPFTAASLTKDGTGTLTLNGVALSGGGTEVSGAIDVNAGTLALAGANALTTGGTITVASGATLSRAGGGAIVPGGTVTDNGTMTFAAGGGLNAAGRSVTVGSGATMSFGGNGGLTAATVTISGGALSFNGGGGGGGGLTATGAVTVTGGSLGFGGTGDLNAGSLSLDSGSTLSIVFNSTTTKTTLAVTGAVTLSGTLNITGSTPSAASSPFTLVSSTNGPASVSGLSLGNVPGGPTYGFRVSGNDILMDVATNPIAADATGAGTGACPGPVTWSHTVGPTTNDRYLLVGISIQSAGGTATPTSVTYGAQGMGQLIASASSANGSRSFLFGLGAPARGTNTITVNLPAGPCSVVAGSIDYTGVNQGTPIRGTNSGIGATAAASVTAATQQGDKVISVVSSTTATSATPQAGATVRWSNTAGTEFGAGSTVARSGGGAQNIPMTWTLSAATTDWSEATAVIEAVNQTRAGDQIVQVRQSADRATVSVRSSPGSDLLGFRVWRELAGQRELLTPGLVSGPAFVSRAALLAGSEAGWLDSRPVPGATYLVESVHLDGTTRWTRAVAAQGPIPSFTSELVGTTPSVISAQQSPRLSAAGVRTSALTSPVSRDAQWRLAAGPAAKLVVSSAGVVHVSAESLFAAGVPVGTPISAIQLFRAGQPIPRSVVSADGTTLRAGDAVEFYGYGMETRYSGSAVYWLTWNGGPGLELASIPAAPVPVATNTYAASSEIRERLVWFGAAHIGDVEKFFGPEIWSGKPDDRTFTLDGLDVSSVGARLEVGVQGLTSGAHSLSLSVNGIPVGTLAFDGAVPASGSVDLAPGALLPGNNTVQIVAPPSDFSLEQYVRFVYPRLTVRASGALEFTLPGGSSTRLEGFDPALTRVLDITNPDAPIRVATWDDSGAAAVTASGPGTRRLVAYLGADTLAPVSVTANQPSNWHSAAGADLVIIGPAALLSTAQPLADQRRREGLRVALVDVEDVQDEFASGEKSADAVQAFLGLAFQSWPVPPRYVLLLGLGTYDPRDYLGLGGDLVPTPLVQTEALEAASDSWYLNVPGGESASIGRLPVRTVAEARAVVSKIVWRPEADAHSAVVLVSDALGSSNFPEMASDVGAALPYARTTMLVREPPDGGMASDVYVHEQLLGALRSGAALVNYSGHGSETFWDGDLHTTDDVPLFAGTSPSLWVEMTCLTAFFQDPRRQSLAVATLLAPEGGAWGAWGSSSITYPVDHPALNRALVKGLLAEGLTLGDATTRALAGVTDPDVKATFVLLGDPSARAVRVPSSPALQVSTKTSNTLGCSSTATSAGTIGLLLVTGAWLVTSRRRARAAVRR